MKLGFCVKLLTLLTLIAVLPQIALGRDDIVPGSRYTSGRSAGLGDAALPLADDGASGLFTNPAGLGRIRKTHFEPLNFQIQTNSQYTGMVNSRFTRVLNLPGYVSELRARPNQFPGVAYSVVPNFSFRGGAIGLMYKTRLAARYNSDGTVRYRSTYQLIPAVGFGTRIANGVVRIGYSLQYVNQASGDVTASADSSTLAYNNAIGQGSGLSHTAGFALTFPFAFLPSFNVVARNIMGTSFNGPSLLGFANNANGTPDTENMTFDASFSIEPRAGKGSKFNIVYVLRDATNQSGLPILMRSALGVEFSFRDQFFLRGGYGSGYPSAGLGLRRNKTEFSLAWYSEEWGTAFQSERDIRFILHFQIRAF